MSELVANFVLTCTMCKWHDMIESLNTDLQRLLQRPHACQIPCVGLHGALAPVGARAGLVLV